MHSTLNESSVDGYTEYSIELSGSTPGGSNGWIQIGHSDDDNGILLYPQTSWFYHQEKDISESIQITYDEEVSGVTPGYRDASTWHIPIKVRLYWLNDGFPEIMDRRFYLIHVARGPLYTPTYSTGFEPAEDNPYFLTQMEFVMVDDDPQIEDSSLRFEGETEGTDYLEGLKGGDETLQFTCIGCGTFFMFCANIVGSIRSVTLLRI